jgi:hypothetical protein
MAMFDERPDDEQEPDPSDGEASGSHEDGELDAAARPGVPVALAATETPVLLHAELVHDDRTPDGMVCMGTYRGDQLIARCVLSPEAWDEIEEAGVFEEPVPVVLVAQEAPPGLQCRLFAMIPLVELVDDEDDDEGDDDAEPWAASVPSSRYEEAIAGADEDDDDEPRIVPLPLGNIVRYDRDRKFPESLPREAVDILQKVIQGRTTEVIDRALADLLGSDSLEP